MALKLTKKNNKVQKVVKKTKATRPSSSSTAPAITVAMPQGEYVETVGRRKTATARVRVYKVAGDFIINNKAAGQYFHTVLHAPTEYNRPFEITETKGKYAVSAVVSGSGAASQLKAVVHGISRALVELEEGFRVPLKSAGLLTRDDRMKETRKIGMGGKARRKRQSPKR
ncbi:MAG: 30S ribosomal protein S9 [bacterium]|nr:30S ribosomal protein S9 [bacterium]